MTYSHVSLLGVLAAATSSSVLAASAAQVQDLGSNFGLEASAAEVSLDGSTVIGTLDRNTNRTDGFRWTEDGGQEILEPLNGTSSRAYDVSDDGSFVTGDGSWFRAVRWGPDGGVLDLGIIPGGSFNTYSKAISGDGQTVVGEATINQSGLTKHAFVWTESTGMVDIHGSVGGVSSTALDVSTDGSVVMGQTVDSGGVFTGFVWNASGSVVFLAVPGLDESVANAMSSDGSVVIGTALNSTTSRLFRWTAAGGVVTIDSPGAAPITRNLSSDGSTIFGHTSDGPYLWTASGGFRIVGTDTSIRFRASSADGTKLYGTRSDLTQTPAQLIGVRWTEALGFEDLATLGGGFDLVFSASGDGAVLAGLSRNPDGLGRAVRWREDGLIGSPYCGPAAPNSVNPLGATITLSGTNVASQGALELHAAGLPPFSFGFFIASSDQGFAMGPGGSEGNLCLGGAIGRYVGPGQIQQSGSDGRFSLTIDPGAMASPSGPILPPFGQTWNFQAWYRDMNPMATSNFTDAASLPIF